MITARFYNEAAFGHLVLLEERQFKTLPAARDYAQELFFCNHWEYEKA